MSPIKVGIIGLSSTQSWAVWAHLPALLNNPSQYTIVALCNSSLSAAQTAIATHNLPPTTKAYASPADLAADPDVQLVVCSIRVDRHFDALAPAIKAGKDVFCEWPLEKSTARAGELAELTSSHGVKTLVGLQASQSPALNKVKELVGAGRIGKVLSSNFYATSTFFDRTGDEKTEYMNDRSVGANQLTVYAAHSLESIRWVLGPWEEFQSTLDVSYPDVEIVDAEGNHLRDIKRSSHDQVLIQGRLESGAVMSYHLRGGPAWAGKEGSKWSIYGTKGQIELKGGNSHLHLSDDDVSIEVFDHESKEVEKVVVEKDRHSSEVLYSRNVARLYESYANGKGKEHGVFSFDDAVKRHQFIDEVYAKAGVV
ncbi:NAD-P-binding protein [Aaosphaeria arxii CBS 175.79]|uniref:NAD-P-binding protein n=1 Tax=Aaosphaeria arxii CBS 175.79 TaxID=1450172 RepID=A0A6A5XGL2_9PLEO|nr:NAD-P-binding protein [Aaosphaeria arxii CBS 175.79]KAF2012222.1 NAD-P-binding protein [Aaosphaeria arxii CBS 175.79]